jgi:hypothetical protein
MADAKTRALLHDIVRREARSFLKYVSEAFPWTNTGENKALGRVQELAQEEERAVAALSQFLTRRRYGMPYLGPYPESFTTLNYVSLDHLLPLLIDHQQQAMVDTERDLAGLYDPEAREQVQKILDMKRRHLLTLEALALVHPEPGAVSHPEPATTAH